MKFPHGKITSISVTALLTVTLSAAVIPAANASTPTVLPVLTATTAVPADSYNAQVLSLINKERVKAGVKPLVWNQSISKVSQDWATHLGAATRSDTFDWATIHRPDAGGSKIPAGAIAYGEIIAFNFTPESIVQWWMNSPSHKATMLSPKQTDIGIGYAAPTTGPYAGWHQVVANLAAYPATTAIPVVPSGVITSAPAISPVPVVTPPATKSAIAIKALSLKGGLGSATGPEIYGLKNGGGYQYYQRGAIIWSPATGARISKGAIRNVWLGTGGTNGKLGYPTSDEIPDGRGGVYQTYQHGAVVYAPGYGTFISRGGIRSVWLASGSAKGSLGYPTSNEITGLKNGGVYQTFQRGAIVYSPGSGTFISRGGIRAKWVSIGAQNSRLGYPTSNEYSGGAGITVQNYQGGKITWTSRGAAVYYK